MERIRADTSMVASAIADRSASDRIGGDREMADILAHVLQHDEQAVLTAVELALAEGVTTKTHVLNPLHRLIDGKVVGVPPLDTPQALTLRREPKANVERYDVRRSQIAGGPPAEQALRAHQRRDHHKPEL